VKNHDSTPNILDLIQRQHMTYECLFYCLNSTSTTELVIHPVMRLQKTSAITVLRIHELSAH